MEQSTELVVCKTEAMKKSLNDSNIRDDIIVYIAQVERDLHAVVKTISEAIPRLAERVRGISERLKEEHAKDCARCEKLAVSRQKQLAAVVKKYFPGAKIEAACEDSGGDHFYAKISVTDDRYYGLTLGGSKKPTLIKISKSNTLRKLAKDREAAEAALSEAQTRLLEARVELQNISRYEREGHSSAIKAQRRRAGDGKSVAQLETAASDRVREFTLYANKVSSKMLEKK